MTPARGSAAARRRALLLSLYTIVFAILILLPLDFRWPRSAAALLPDPTIRADWSWLELARWVAHFSLFVPIGLLIHGLPRGSKRRFVIAVGAALLLTVAAEMAQVVVTRIVSWLDVLVNLLGIAGGFEIGLMLDRSARLRRFVAAFRSPLVLIVAIGALTALVVFLSLPLEQSWSNWKRSYPFLVANERSGDRPWFGELFELALYDRALPPEEAAACSEVGAPPPPGRPLLRYVFDAASMEVDHGAVQRIRPVRDSEVPLDLVVRSGTPTVGENGGLSIEDASLLTTLEPPSELYERILARGALSIVLRFRARDLDAVGPARIVGFSFSPWYRNLTVAQSAGRLVLRVRNAVAGENGLQPQLETSACLTPEHVQTAVAVCTIPETRLFVDGAQRGRVRYNRFTTVADRLLHWSAQPILEAALLILAAIAYLFAYFSLLRPLGVSGWREVGAATLAALTLAAAVVLPLLVPA